MTQIENILNDVQKIRQRIFLMGTPLHGNLGDQAIVMGEYKILQNIFPHFAIIEIPCDYFAGAFGLGLKNFVRSADIIFFMAGAISEIFGLARNCCAVQLYKIFQTTKLLFSHKVFVSPTMPKDAGNFR